MGRRGGCVGAVALAVAVVAGALLVLVVAVMVSFWLDGRRDEAAARNQLAAEVDRARDGLARAAADGALLGTEIERIVLKGGRGEVRREGRRVTVTAHFTGFVGSSFSGAAEHGCYRFQVVPAAGRPLVSVRQVPYNVCTFPRGAPYRDPAAVAEDVTAELRTAVREGGAEGARTADVWRTSVVRVEGSEVEGDRLVALVWLSGGDEPETRDCYEFRARSEPGTVTARKLEPDGCYGIDRKRSAEGEAERKARVDAAARTIEQRMEEAVGDGTLTESELSRVLRLPRIDLGGRPVTGEGVAVPVGMDRRSPGEVIVKAEIEPLDATAMGAGCYEFRARLAEKSVTRRATGADCLS